MKLSDHFALDEFLFSQTAIRHGIKNEPDDTALAELKKTARLMERVRSMLGHPIHITSGYRGEKLNELIGGSKRSQHCLGQACDFVCPGYGTPREISKLIEGSDLNFDQLIYEGNWVHISQGPYPRVLALTAQFKPGGVDYIKGIV